jgi:hypothetical protein
MEEIILVTGLHLTRSWANIVFLEGNVNGRASLGVKVNDGREVSITWRCEPGSVRGGMRSWEPEGKVCLASEIFRDNPSIILCSRQNLLENQCVLVRGFRVTRVSGILPLPLRGAAGPDPGDHNDD